MGLLELWNENRRQVEDKRLHQLIAFAGDGRLLDGGATAAELRQLLAAAPSECLQRWKDEALADRYDGFGFVLQDLVNEVGRRLGFSVTFGRYRGRSGDDSPDGVWTARDGHVLLVESKTSSSHRIELSKLAEWRRRLAIEAIKGVKGHKRGQSIFLKKSLPTVSDVPTQWKYALTPYTDPQRTHRAQRGSHATDCLCGLCALCGGKYSWEKKK